MFDDAIVYSLTAHLENKIKNKGIYRKYKDLDHDEEKGKNKEVEWVLSSKKTLWLYKPVNHVYSIRAATKEVFFGELAVMLYGDDYAPKTKFSLERAGILSKLISQDRSVSCDLYNFINKNGVNCNRNARINFMNLVIFSAMIENRDVRIENIIAEYNKKDNYYFATKIYGIDYEFAAPSQILFRYNNCDLVDLLALLFKDYKIFVNYIFSDKLQGLPDNVKWNIHKIQGLGSPGLIKGYTEMFTLGLTQEFFIDCFKETANKICADNYKIYDEVAQKIEERLNCQITQIYSVEKINQQVQQIIVRQKNNMLLIKQFISAYDQQQAAAIRPSISLKT